MTYILVQFNAYTEKKTVSMKFAMSLVVVEVVCL